MKTLFTIFAAIIITVTTTQGAVSIDNLLESRVNANPVGLTPVVITFNERPTNSDFNMLRSLGITGGRTLNQLPIVLTSVNKLQFNALKTKPSV